MFGLILALSLAGEWTLQGTDQYGEKISCKAFVPGDVHSALLAAGKMPDPYKGRNEVKTQWIGRKRWTFIRDFEVGAELLSKKIVKLRLTDCDTFADIFINDVRVGRTTNRFRRFDFDVKNVLKPGKNTIRGVFKSAELMADRLAEERGVAYPMANSPWAKNMASIRKPACHGGWDWGLAQMTTGFCGDVELIASDDPIVSYLYTDQKFNDDLSHCTLTVTAELSDGTRDQKKIEIDNPPLWWPNGYGERKFYEFEFHGIRKRIGLRKMEVLNEKTKSADGKDELSLVVRVNNRRVFCKGANWIPCDAFESRQTPEKYRNLLESAARANMNMIRLWGGGQYERDVFYDLCDELGIMIWHDMMCSCAVYPGDNRFLREIEQELAHQLRRLRDHASIALWCGDNECLGAIGWFPQTSAKADFYRQEWVKRSKRQEECVAKYDPTRIYWPSSPCCGPGDFGDGWKNDSKGDMHNWHVWGGNKPFADYYNYRPRFCSEFGYQSFPSLEIALTFASEKDVLARGPDFEWHQKGGDAANTRIRDTMRRYFAAPKDVPSELLLSQFQQGMGIRIAAEAWRAQRPRCMGVLFWQLDDNWPVSSWSSIEYGGKWKPLQYMAKRFFAPVAVVAHPDGKVRVLNDTKDDLSGDVVLEYWSYDGKILKTDRLPIVAKADAVTVAGKFKPMAKTFLVMNFKGYVNDWHFGAYKDQPLAKAKIVSKLDGNKLTISTDKPAFFVWANVTGVKGEFDDNAITLLPGRPRTLTFAGELDVRKLSVSDLSGLIAR